MMNEPVKSIMTSNLVTLTPDNSLSDVRDIFLKKRIHHLPIVENGELVGLITTSDLWKMDRPMSEYDKIKTGDVMTRHLAVLEPEDKVGTAAEIFLENKFHALPIVEGGKNIVGIVTSFDVLQYSFDKEYERRIL